MAVFSGGMLGLFYTGLLSAHGFKNISYKYTAIVIGIVILLASFFSLEVGGAVIGVIAIGVFILAIALFVRGFGGSLQESAAKLSQKSVKNTSEITKAQTPVKLINYYGVAFHLVVAILIALSIFTYSDNTLLSKERMETLIMDFVFQFSSTVALMIIGIFNPFVKPGEKLLKLGASINPDKYPLLHNIFTDARSWMFMKAIICVLILRYLFGDNFLILPDWTNTIANINGYVVIIYIFIILNIIQLIRNPELFFKKNVLRVVMLFRSAFMGIFVAAILVFATLFGSALLGIDVDKLKVSSEGILFLGFNIVMAYNEYKVANA